MDKNADQSLPFIKGEKFAGDPSACSTKPPRTYELPANPPEPGGRLAREAAEPYDQYLQDIATGEGMPEAPIRA